MNGSIYRLSGRFKGFLFLTAIVFILALLLYTQKLVNGLRSEVRGYVQFYAGFYERAASGKDDASLNFIFDQIIKRTDFPIGIILSDVNGEPTSWKGIGIRPEEVSEKAKTQVRAMMATMKKEIEPIPLKFEEHTLGYLYYGDSRLIRQLQWLPYAEILLAGLFLLITIFGLNSIRRSEQQFIWVGMAKETAHQLGTPISSLLGWVELLRSRENNAEAAVTLTEMQRDLERLSKVASRFSQIGSRAALKEQELLPIIDEVVHYFQRRLPQMGKEVRIDVASRITPTLPINRDLFEWVLENLLKNALDAIEKPLGIITIDVQPSPIKRYRALIDVRDNGRGIDPAVRKQIFKPGFSTKKRGWGLGLSLSQRIIEDYHRGKLLLKDSRPGDGTTMRILL
jgi:hypothetical protein